MAILLGLLFVIPMLFFFVFFVLIYIVIKGFWYLLKAVFTGEI